MAWWGWSYLLTITGLVAIWQAGKGRRWGWAVGLAGEGLWIVYATLTRQWGFIIAAAAYAVVYARNFVRVNSLHGESAPQ